MQNNYILNSEFKVKYPSMKYPSNVVNEDLSDYNDIFEIQNKLLQIQSNTATELKRNNELTLSNRLSCDELESLKERYVDFINVNNYPTRKSIVDEKIPQIPIQSKPSKSCAQLAQTYQRSLYASKYDLENEYYKQRPEPPQRTVSIRHSSHYTSSPLCINESLLDDDIYSMKSLYSSCIASSGASTSGSSSYSNSSNNGSGQSVRHYKSAVSINEMDDIFKHHESTSERLTDDEIRKIQIMYQSINCTVYVGQSTVNFYTTHSDQIANLQDCWKLQLGSVVPVWLFDKRNDKQLKLVFVSKTTAFAFCENILITHTNQFKNPKEKHITFKIDNLICLISFSDYFSCQHFFKFYTDSNTNLSHNNQNLKLKFIKNKKRTKSTDTKNKNKIDKNFISSPCAFQHVNCIKTIDQQHVQQIIVKKS